MSVTTTTLARRGSRKRAEQALEAATRLHTEGKALVGDYVPPTAPDNSDLVAAVEAKAAELAELVQASIDTARQRNRDAKYPWSNTIGYECERAIGKMTRYGGSISKMAYVESDTEHARIHEPGMEGLNEKANTYRLLDGETIESLAEREVGL